MDNFIDYLYNLLVKYNTYFIIKQHINADTNKALSDLYSTMKERSVKELEDFCINQQNNKTPSILLEIYKRCNRFMEVNKEQYDTHRIWDNLNTSNVYEQSKTYCRLIDYYFSIDINGYQERGINTKRKQQVELPKDMNTELARKAFDIAIKLGFIEVDKDKYRWLKTNVLLAYLCSKLYCNDKDSDKHLPESSISILFGISRIGSSLTQMMSNKNGKPRGYEIIDNLLIEALK